VENTLKWAMGNPEAHCRVGHFMPVEWERDFCISVGSNFAKRVNEPRWKQLQDVLVEYKGVTAWAHGHHMQFLAYRDTIAPFITRNPLVLDNQHFFNVPVDEAGYLQLTTHKRTAVHIGNEIDPSVVKIYEDWNARE
jgi:hypothetical protein